MNESEAKNIINTIKLLAIDMIDAAQSGNPGIVLDAAPILYLLYANHLRIDPKNPTWVNRDRFVMSSGHGSALLYATLFMAGFDFTLEDLVRFRQINSKTPGHPEKNINKGIEYSTGLAGEGFAAAVGMAMSEKYLNGTISKYVQNQRIINHKIYCFVSDGDLEEGISYEAASLASTNALDNLIVLYDSNAMTADGSINKTSNESLLKRFDALGWYVEYVKDVNNLNELDKAINKAKRNKNAPTIIEIKSIIGQDSFNAGTTIVHGKPLSKDDIYNLHQTFNLETSKFEIVAKYIDEFRELIEKRVRKDINKWQEYADTFHLTNYPEIQVIDRFLETGKIELEFESKNFRIQSSYEEDLRRSNSKIMNIIADRTPFFIGGSSDLQASCITGLIKHSDFSKDNYAGRNFFFGVREHAMGAIINGMATYDLKPFASTYLVYSDYLKSTLRTAAMMNIKATYIFTHDSINIGEDGKSHQPIEQLKTLRNIPNLYVYRPGDINEVIGCWDSIFKENKPTALVIARTKIHILAGTNGEECLKGAYIVKKEKEKYDAILISSGSDLTTTLLIADDLKEEYDLRVVSMPCQELFLDQDEEYQKEILPKDAKIIAIESSTRDNYFRFTTYDRTIGVEEFGYSGKPQDVLKAMKFDKNSIEEKVKAILRKQD